MRKLFYSIEDSLEDHALDRRLPWWVRHLMQSLARTFGEAGDLVANR